MDYVLTIIDSLRTLCGQLLHQGPFTASYCLLELYHQIVSCVYGNEKLSKLKLGKRRGYGLNAEMFTQDLQLSALGLKLAYPFLKNISFFVSGESKKELVSFIMSVLYFREVNSLAEEAMCSEVEKNITKLIMSHIGCLSDESAPEVEYGAVSLPYFVDVFSRKYRRNFLKSLAGRILGELWTESKNFQDALCLCGLILFISHGGKHFQFDSKNLNSTLNSLKKWLKGITGGELASLWYQYAIKKMEVSVNDEFAMAAIDNILSSSAKDLMDYSGINIGMVLLEPDIVSR